MLSERTASAICPEDAQRGAKGHLHGYADAMQAVIAKRALEVHSHRTHSYFIRVAMRAASLDRYSAAPNANACTNSKLSAQIFLNCYCYCFAEAHANQSHFLASALAGNLPGWFPHLLSV